MCTCNWLPSHRWRYSSNIHRIEHRFDLLWPSEPCTIRFVLYTNEMSVAQLNLTNSEYQCFVYQIRCVGILKMYESDCRLSIADAGEYNAVNFISIMRWDKVDDVLAPFHSFERRIHYQWGERDRMKTKHIQIHNSAAHPVYLRLDFSFFQSSLSPSLFYCTLHLHFCRIPCTFSIYFSLILIEHMVSDSCLCTSSHMCTSHTSTRDAVADDVNCVLVSYPIYDFSLVSSLRTVGLFARCSCQLRIHFSLLFFQFFRIAVFPFVIVDSDGGKVHRFAFSYTRA